MTKVLCTLAALAGIALAAPANACMDVNGPAVLLDNRPAAVPRGFVLLRLKRPAAQPTAASARLGYVPAVVADGDQKLIGQRILIDFRLTDSCGYWAQSNRSAYVVGQLYRSAGQLRLKPKSYVVRTH